MKTACQGRGARLGRILLFLLLWGGHASPGWGNPDPCCLFEMSLEELQEIEITSVSKKPQKYSDAAAAVFVISQEDIRRSGATSIPEVLRMVPGLHVARVDASKWAISSRGFNGLFANKLLVLMDGRSVYSPLFSGVFWEAQDTALEDIERIEVIRGPGATVWGANAVNGVINILTRHGRDTQGGLVSFGAGDEERAFGTFRYGGKGGDDLYWRIYGKGFRRDDGAEADGGDGADGWKVGRGGFRIDWESSRATSLRVQGDLYEGEAGIRAGFFSLIPPFGEVREDETEFRGGNLVTRLEHTLSDSSDLSLQISYDRTRRRDIFFGEVRDTLDLDFNHRFAWGERHEVVWGLGYRLSRDEFDPSSMAVLDPESRSDDLFSGFLQDEFVLLPERLRLVLGSKFEHNETSGFEVQPSLRLLWTPDGHQTVWGAVSRAVRTPSRFEEGGTLVYGVLPPGHPDNPAALPVLLQIEGDDRFDAEELLAWELGHRIHPSEKWHIDTALFYNRYENLRFASQNPSFAGTHIVNSLRLGNGTEGQSYGVEVALDWKPADWVKAEGAYTYYRLRLEGEMLGAEKSLLDTSSRHQVSLRTLFDLPAHTSLDLWLRYVDSLPLFDIPGYLTMDARIAWRPTEALELSLVGQNLFDPRRPEFHPESVVVPTETERGFYGKATWRF